MRRIATVTAMFLVCVLVGFVSAQEKPAPPPAQAAKAETVTPVPVPTEIVQQIAQAQDDVRVWSIAAAAMQEKLDAAQANFQRAIAKAQRPGFEIQTDPQTRQLIYVPKPEPKK